MAVATENTLKKQLMTSYMFNDRIRTTNSIILALKN